MTPVDHQNLNGIVGDILNGPHLSILATTCADGRAQTSVIFVKPDGSDLLFSTIEGRGKTINMRRNPRVNLLIHRLPPGQPGRPYVTVSGTVELTTDPGGAFHEVTYGLHMGGATPPPEPGAKRVIVRIRPEKVYVPKF
jgi:PPOX class probable F420-dependent enzyme